MHHKCFLLYVVVVVCVAAKDLPDYFPRCRRNDPKLNECLVNATRIVKPYLARGVPELKFPPLEPFLIPQIQFEQGTQAVNFKATLYNLSAVGLTDYEFSKFDFDVPNLSWHCKARIDKLYVTGLYKVTGKVLVAPIEGKGTFTVNITNIDLDLYQKVKTIQKRGEEYIQPINTTTKVEIGDALTDLKGLFDGNSALAKATNDVINDNIQELFHEVKPVLEKIITQIGEELLFKTIEGAIPFGKLYPVS